MCPGNFPAVVPLKTLVTSYSLKQICQFSYHKTAGYKWDIFRHPILLKMRSLGKVTLFYIKIAYFLDNFEILIFFRKYFNFWSKKAYWIIITRFNVILPQIFL